MRAIGAVVLTLLGAWSAAAEPVAPLELPASARVIVFAPHPDDETLGLGGVFARYAAEGVETAIVTATMGQKGRYRGLPPGDPGHPGAEKLAEMREAELKAAVKVLGIGELKRAVTVHAHHFSRSAAEKIQAAGGKAVVIEG